MKSKAVILGAACIALTAAASGASASPGCGIGRGPLGIGLGIGGGGGGGFGDIFALLNAAVIGQRISAWNKGKASPHAALPAQAKASPQSAVQH